MLLSLSILDTVGIFGASGFSGLLLLIAFVLAWKSNWDFKGMPHKLRFALAIMILLAVTGLSYSAVQYKYRENILSFDKVYEGVIDKDIYLVMSITSSNGTVSGKEYYKKIKDDIILDGTYKSDGSIILREQYTNGTTSGEFKGKLSGETITGIWKSMKTGKNRKFKLTETEAEYEAFR